MRVPFSQLTGRREHPPRAGRHAPGPGSVPPGDVPPDAQRRGDDELIAFVADLRDADRPLAVVRSRLAGRTNG